MTEVYFYKVLLYACERYSGSISSMHRTVKHNKKVGGADNSQHLGYKAADFIADDWSKKGEIVSYFHSFGLYVYDEVVSDNHLHVDDRMNSQVYLPHVV